MRALVRTLLALLLGAAISPAWAANPTFVQSGGDSDAGFNDWTITMASNITAGNWVALFLRVDHGVTVSSVVFPGSQTPTLLDSCTVSCGNAKDFYLYRVTSATGGGTDITFHVSTTAALQYEAVEYTNVGSEVAYASLTSLSSANPQTCPATTATGANQMAVSFFNITTANHPAPGNGETERIDDGRTQIEEKATSGAGSVANKVSLDTSVAAECAQILLGGTAGSPTFSVAPSYSTVDANTLRATFTCNGSSATAKGGLYVAGGSAPTAAQVAAGTNAHGTANVACTGSSQTLDIDASDSPVLPKYDPYVILDLSGSYSTVPSTTTTCVDPPAGFLFSNCPTGLTDVAASGSLPEQFNAQTFVNVPYDTLSGSFHSGDMLVDSTSGAWGFIVYTSGSSPLVVDKRSGTFSDNDAIADLQGGSALVNGATSAYTQIATGDILVVPDHVSPAGDTATCPGDPECVTVDSSGNIDFTAAGRQTLLNTLIYDDSAHAYLTVDIDAYIRNAAPLCTHPSPTQVFTTSVAITAVDFNTLCSDDDVETLHYGTIGTTAWPAGLSISRVGSESGTPTVENESGAAMAVIAFDGATDTAEQDLTVYPITSWTLGDYTDFTTANAQSAINTLTHNTVTVNSTSGTDPVIASGHVISQSPAAGAEVAPGDTETLHLSVGPPSDQSAAPHIGIRIGVGL